MCGRFTLVVSLQNILDRYTLDVEELNSLITFYRPSQNIAPTQTVLAVVFSDNRPALKAMRWGLIPFWAKDTKIGNKLFNARAETLHEKPSFRHLIARKRCLIPADGFYEFREENKKKIPVKFSRRDRNIFSFAGLYDIWKDTNNTDTVITSCTIITTEPNELVAAVHNRMPVILNKDDESVWLDPQKQHYRDVQYLLRPCADPGMIREDADPEITRMRR